VTVADPNAGSADVRPAEPAARVRAVIERVLEALELTAEVRIDESEELITARIEGEDDLGLLIGRH
jgi:predicted RNA-binding protein Jag